MLMKLLTILFFVFVSFLSLAQTEEKHPRVMEFEDSVSKEAMSYLNTRFPGRPFLAQVSVSPIRRSNNKSEKFEALPYLEEDGEEAIDEWDDLNLPLTFLRNRVKKIDLIVHVPVDFDDYKITELKQELISVLKLIPFRDEVKLERKFKTEESTTPAYIYISIGAIILGLLILGLIIRWSASKVVMSIKEGSISRQVERANSQVSQLPQRPAPQTSPLSGDFNFHDPVKTSEAVHIKIHLIEDSKTFPTLHDIIELGILAEKSPEQLGALLYEMPRDWQSELLKIGKDLNWLQSFVNPGTLNQNVLNVLEKLTRNREMASHSREFEDLLIQVWRMGDEAINLLKKLDSNVAFAILELLPKSMSLKIAKKAYPGSWGKILEQHFADELIDHAEILKSLKLALDMMPYNESGILKNYKRDKDLFEYLDLASIDDERDVYQSLSQDSLILKNRPPFFKVFDLDESKLRELTQGFPLDKLALALSNANPSYVKKIYDCLDDKKKIIFASLLKRPDQEIDHELERHWKKVLAQEALTIQKNQEDKA